MSVDSKRKLYPLCGVLSSLRLGFGECNKPHRGFRRHPLYKALAPLHTTYNVGPELWENSKLVISVPTAATKNCSMQMGFSELHLHKHKLMII